MRIICKVKNLHAIRLKCGDRFLTPLTKSVFEAEAGIYYTIKENLRLYVIGICYRFYSLTYFSNKVCSIKKHRL